MKSLCALLIYLAVVLLGAAALAPWIWQGVQATWPGASIAHQPFHRYVDRCLLGLALLGLWPLLRALGVNSWKGIGVEFSRSPLSEGLRGLALGWISLGIAALVMVLVGAREWNPTRDATLWWKHLRNAVTAAIIVSALEELLFRGAIYSALRRSGSFAFAAGVSSALYAFVHFFQRPPSPINITATSGFQTLGLMLRGFVAWRELVPGLLALGLAGYLLAYAREQTGRLWMGMGMHAGWIFWLKSFAFTTTAVEGANLFWGTHRLYDGWPALGVLGLAALLLYRWLEPKEAR